MFDGLILGKFSKKCKQAVRCIKWRTELIKKKKRVVVRILKKDVADLIAAGHESSGFGRMDTLIAEINLLSCYETIEKLCECILNQLPTLQKQRECPEESKEAISTLIYAAARFSDLPELRDLRSLFAERYGSCMESSVNAEFAEKTKRKSFSREWKFKVMQDIADEFSISWRNKKGEESCNHPSPESVDQTRSEQVSLDKHQAQTETKTRNSPPETHTERNHDHGGRKMEEQNIVSAKKPKPVKDAVTQPYGKRNGINKTRAKIKNEEENNGFQAEKPTKPVSVRRQFEDNAIHEEMATSLDREDLDSYMALGYGKFLRPRSSGEKGQQRGDTEATRDERDEEEKILDELLLYYSRKGTDEAAAAATTSRASKMDDCERDIVKHQHENEEEKILDELLLYYRRKGTDEAAAATTTSRASKMDDDCERDIVKHQHEDEEGHRILRIKVPPPKRTSSDTTSHCRGRVHPRLPDYDQLAARFTALKNGLGTL